MSDIYESVGNYTKFKVVEMLIDKHKDSFKDLNHIEQVADDVCNVLTICGMKYYSELNDRFSLKEDDDKFNKGEK